MYKINIIWFLATLMTLDDLHCFLHEFNRKTLNTNQIDNDYEYIIPKNSKENHLVFSLNKNENFKLKYRSKEYFYDVYKMRFEDSDKDDFVSDENQQKQLNIEKKSDGKKNRLKDFLKKTEKNDDERVNEQPNQNLAFGQCSLAPFQMTLNLENCGRITFNTTACFGLCKSSEQIITNTKLKKRSCWACKPHKFVNVKYEIRCLDNSNSIFTLKAISECSCFKYSETILPLDIK
ncbi:unnamed protein product [Brachionus calyciflorus]|uniref:CTCK domain-containing protein n=1 Tax=Brachionus calyciflorus TaxID=104777 RepID=A0A813VZY9_9BILA|nr:unnamed protein product [Brachionus calyciflorus]